jgi:prevent-host-death family protein
MKTIIRPITDLSKNMALIDEYAVQENNPVYITKGGTSYLVVMSHEHFEKMQEELAFFKRLLKAETESRNGELVDIDDLDDELNNIIKKEPDYDHSEQPDDRKIQS